jgi:xylan 1,4-beta-xylosidase
VARATSPTGPFEKYASNPILVGDDDVQGPGHGSVLQVGDHTIFIHHGWVNGNGRYLFISPITWENEWPRIDDGTVPLGPMPWP